MRHLLLKTSPNKWGQVHIEGKDAHYLTRVLRLGPGDSFHALCPDGRPVFLRIDSLNRGGIDCSKIDGEDAGNSSGELVPGQTLPNQPSQLNQPSQPNILLMLAWPKGQKLDKVIRQAVEAAVSDIVIFVSDHSVARPGREEREKKLQRLERIAKEALQQSGATRPCRLYEADSLEGAIDIRDQLFADFGNTASLLMHQDALAQRSIHEYLSLHPEYVAIGIGSEGGFSSRECELSLKRNFFPCVLGRTVLRCETAAIFAIAAVEIILMERTSWQSPSPPCRG